MCVCVCVSVCLSVCLYKWRNVKWIDVEWTGLIYVKWFCFEMKWVTVNFLGTKAPCTLWWPYTEGSWLYCDNSIWCVSCTVVVLIGFVMCGWVYVGVFWQLCGCFGNMCTCIYCVLYCLYCVFVLFRLCIFILICVVCTGVRTTASQWQLNCSK